MRWFSRFAGVGLLGIALMHPLSAMAATFRVDTTATTNGPGTALDWSDAFNNLQDAISWAANPLNPGPDEVHVAQGDYKAHGSDRSVSFVLHEGLNVRGGYAGIGASDPNARDIDLYETILSGDLADDDDPSGTFSSELYDDNSFHVVRADSPLIQPGNTRLEGFTISNGAATCDTQLPLCPDQQDGGGMLNRNGASPFVADCTFRSNFAGLCGGGMHNVGGSSPRVLRCRFEGNKAQAGGGLANCDASSPLIVDCVFLRNHAPGNGGGIYCQDNSAPTIINCQFLGNTAHHVGGGIGLRDNSIAITTVITNCTFVGNIKEDFGGGMRAGRDTRAVLTNCTFVANSAGPYVGLPFSGAGGGFAIGADSCEVDARESELRNCIVWGNTLAPGEPGDPPAVGPQIALRGAAPAQLRIWNTDVQDAESGGVYVQPGEPCDPGEVFVLIWETTELDADPLFVRSPSPGTDGEWGTDDDDYGALGTAGNLRRLRRDVREPDRRDLQRVHGALPVRDRSHSV